MKTRWIVGVVAAAHCVALGSVLLMSGCGRTTGATTEPAPLPPASEVKPTPMPPVAEAETNVFKPTDLVPVPPAKKWDDKTTSYTVAKGDTLSGIAKKFHVKLGELAAINKLKKDSKIRIGQKLLLPGAVDVKAAAATSKSTKSTKVAGKTKKAATVKHTAAAAAPEKPAADAAVAPQAEATAPAVEEATKPVMAPQTFRTHIVDQGEDLVGISKMWEVSVDEIKKVNGLVDDNVKLGQKLKIPVQ